MDSSTSAEIPAGTFTPDPQRAGAGTLVLVQGLAETRMFLRHGEQLLLSVIIPLGLLIGLSLAPVDAIDGIEDPVGQGFPMMLAIAATSSGFTGQAISLSFDRRYGALKRSGASGVPAWVIICGRAIAVAAMLIVQTAILVTAALILGWRTDIPGALMGLVILVVGSVVFTIFGLLMGGSLPSELVLALANIVWVILVGIVGFVLYSSGLDGATWWDLIPSVALASGLGMAFNGAFPVSQLLILIAWGVIALVAARRWFRFAG